MGWVLQVAQDGIHWLVVMNTVMNLGILCKWGTSCAVEQL